MLLLRVVVALDSGMLGSEGVWRIERRATIKQAGRNIKGTLFTEVRHTLDHQESDPCRC